MDGLSELTFNSLVKRYRRSLTAAAYHLCGDREAAQDIVQETLVDAYRGFSGLRDPERVGAWLYAILRRKAFAHHRAKRPVLELSFDPGSPPTGEAEDLVRGIVIDQVERLPLADREILAGKYLLGLSYRELSESLGIKEGAIRVRCLRAKERLREALQGAGIKAGDEHGV